MSPHICYYAVQFARTTSLIDFIIKDVNNQNSELCIDRLPTQLLNLAKIDTSLPERKFNGRYFLQP